MLSVTLCADLLNALHGKKGAARSLYAAIFLGHTAKLQERRGGSFGARGLRPQQQRRQLPKAPRRIPARLKPLLNAMQALLGDPDQTIFFTQAFPVLMVLVRPAAPAW